MYYSLIIAASVAAVVPFVNAHGAEHGHVPKIVGYPGANTGLSSLRREMDTRALGSDPMDIGYTLEGRDSPPNCGEGIGSCPAGECCSVTNYCGTSDAHCYAPGCNYKYGPGCPENNPPAGTNTSSITRKKLGDVKYGGTGIFNCVKPGTVALTFDDGPQKVFTEHILDLLKSYNAKATFFITGNNINKGQIDIHHADVIKRTEREGHQIASHTWTHLNLSRISSVDRKNQLWMNEMALRNILGKIPTYLRPPYSSCTEESGCQKDVEDLGYHITNFDVDTDDYNQNTPENIQKSKDLFVGKISQEQKYKSDDERAWLSIGHDILEQTAMNLTEYMLETLVQLNYTAVTVGECLNDPKENWYRKAEGAETSVETNTSNSASATTSSADATGTPDTTATNDADLPESSTSGSSRSKVVKEALSLVATVLVMSVAFACIL